MEKKSWGYNLVFQHSSMSFSWSNKTTCKQMEYLVVYFGLLRGPDSPFDSSLSGPSPTKSGSQPFSHINTKNKKQKFWVIGFHLYMFVLILKQNCCVVLFNSSKYASTYKKIVHFTFLVWFRFVLKWVNLSFKNLSPVTSLSHISHATFMPRLLVFICDLKFISR